ncbi:GGDEF domain-containing protein [Mesorhizobium sp. 1M-11]|uniref:GGDEF domain-containing protein n=1 Tax=Mesorhizobium sp. 1M-11 TaxID=1529006 RepID=UPI00137A0242|nr:GGDEF domain-containing protein [Mesorhizobium sp. 1M-11]
MAILCAAVLAAMILSRAWNDFAEARQNHHDIQNFRQILDTANFISAERGPANDVMSDPSGTALKRLADFRARSDTALASLAAKPEVPILLHDHSIPPGLLDAVAESLAAARAKVDRAATVQGGPAKLRAMQDAIEAMFAASDRFRAVVTWHANELTGHDSGLSEPVLVGQMLADLREYGGRIASEVIAPLATRQRIPLENIIDARRDQGRINQIWHMLRGQTAPNAMPDLAGNQAVIDTLFFGIGMDMVDAIIKQGKDSSDYPITAVELTKAFVPTMKSVEDYRTAFLDKTVSRVAAERDAALRLLATVSLATAIVLGVLVGVLLSVRRDVFRPLLQAREEVIGLAEDRPLAARSDPGGAGEMARLFDAIDVLQGRMRERASLTSELRLQAETDGLTGVLNRRTLDYIAQNGDDGLPAEDALGLIMIDIDHFKGINDTHGHLAGDRVLVETARLLKREVPIDCVVARFGGEEFALLFSCSDIDQAGHLAETIRGKLQDHRFTLSEGRQIAITASFGVACGKRGPRDWRHLVERADKALYRAKSDGRNRVSIAPATMAGRASGKDSERMRA